MADRAEKSRRDRREPHPLAVLAGVLAAFLLLAACYVGYQALHILFPQNVYETALPATVSDNVEADGVLLFDEVYVSGSGTLGYLAADGERVSAGTAVAEIYSDASQAVLRQQLTQLTEQIDLLQRSQNTTSLQLDALLRERSAALYDMMDELDAGAYDEVSSGANAYLLAQNKLWIATGDSANFTDQVTALTQQAQSVQAQLGNPDSILARVIREHDGHVSGQSAFMAARLGDPVGQQVCDMYVGYLAAGIANVVNIFQPDTLAIGGGVSNESDEQLLHPLQQLVERETIPCSAGKKTRIVKAQLGNQAGIIGAALLGKKKRI